MTVVSLCVIYGRFINSFNYYLVFWQEDKLRQIAPALVEQVAVCAPLNVPNGKPTYTACLSNLTDCVTDDTLLKFINLNVLMHARSDDARLRLLSLTCSETLWRAHGGKLLG
jgi:U3 small nucleolar RNA-associated protein 10